MGLGLHEWMDGLMSGMGTLWCSDAIREFRGVEGVLLVWTGMCKDEQYL